jgi:hypothetical protein
MHNDAKNAVFTDVFDEITRGFYGLSFISAKLIRSKTLHETPTDHLEIDHFKSFPLRTSECTNTTVFCNNKPTLVDLVTIVDPHSG